MELRRESPIGNIVIKTLGSVNQAELWRVAKPVMDCATPLCVAHCLCSVSVSVSNLTIAKNIAMLLLDKNNKCNGTMSNLFGTK